MIKNKKYILISIFIFTVLMFGGMAIEKAKAVNAIDPSILQKQYNTATTAGLSGRNLYEVTRSALFYLLGIIGVLGMVSLVVTGIMYITAAGDQDRVGLAKKMLTFSIIGIAVALLGLVIVQALNFVIGG